MAEEYTSWGRIDLVVRVEGRVYLIEFKVIEDEGGSALEELKVFYLTVKD